MMCPFHITILIITTFSICHPFRFSQQIAVEARLNFVEVMHKIPAVVFLCNVNKFVFSNSQGSAATQLRCGRKYYLYLEILCAVLQ